MSESNNFGTSNYHFHQLKICAIQSLRGRRSDNPALSTINIIGQQIRSLIIVFDEKVNHLQISQRLKNACTMDFSVTMYYFKIISMVFMCVYTYIKMTLWN